MTTNFTKSFMVKPGSTVKLSNYDPDGTLGWEKGRRSQEKLEKAIERLDELQYLMYAERKRSLLIILQGRDASGKDGTVRHVMAGLDPQGCRVTTFKEPSPLEKAHDFLWRVHAAIPETGEFGIFNRSHYEDVLIVRVHNLVPKDVWLKRYDQINAFESMLAQNNVKIVKFFLHISRDEQKKRFLQRLDDPTKQWKLSQADFNERKFWDAYTQAYEAALSRCTTSASPWFIIPSDKKWFRNVAISDILVEVLEELKMEFPPPSIDTKTLKWH